MKKLIFFMCLTIFFVGISFAYSGTSGTYEWRFFVGDFESNATSGNYDIRVNAGDYPADNFTSAGYTGYVQEYDLESSLSVSLISPSDGSSTLNTSIFFDYTLISPVSVNCSLFIDGNNVDTNNNLTSGDHNFTQTLTPALYSWYVNCTNGTETALSDTWSFIITSPSPPPPSGSGGGGGSRYFTGMYSISIEPLCINNPSNIFLSPPVSGFISVFYEQNGIWIGEEIISVKGGLGLFTPIKPGKYLFQFKLNGIEQDSLTTIANVCEDASISQNKKIINDEKDRNNIIETPDKIEEDSSSEKSDETLINNKINLFSKLIIPFVILAIIIFCVILFSSKKHLYKSTDVMQNKEFSKKVESITKKNIKNSITDLDSDIDRIHGELAELKKRYRF